MTTNDGNATGTIQSVSREARLFPPSKEFTARALINDAAAYEKLYRRSIDDPEGFWAETARAELTWIRDFKKVLDWKLPYSKWFEDGQLNLSANCLDRHLATRGDKVAIEWEGEPGDSRKITYRELHAEVCKFANAMKALGIVAGDRVAIYMPMIPEAAVAMLACTRIGATHTVVFGGFSAEALRDRINDCGAKLCITADGGWRRGKSVPLKANVDGALAQTPSVKSCIVARRTKDDVDMQAGRDVWWHDVMAKALGRLPARGAVRRAPAVHPLHVGHDRQAEGHRAHDGGLPAGRAPDDEVRVRSARRTTSSGAPPTSAGSPATATSSTARSRTARRRVMYEGAPDHPEKDRFWEIIERRKVTIFYTAPTAIRAFMRWGNEFPKKHDLSSLRLLGSVGEPINPEAWMWYHEVIGGDALPDRRHLVADRDRRHHDHAAAGRHADQAGQLRAAVLRRRCREVVKRDGTPCAPNEGGFLVIKKPWPSMLRGDLRRSTSATRSSTGREIPGVLLHGRRRRARTGRLLLGHGPRRRRAERRRPPAGDGGDRERAGVAPEGRRGGRGRAAARAEGAGDLSRS